jgi:lysozyme family protein
MAHLAGCEYALPVHAELRQLIMKANYARSLVKVLAHEGGFVNHKADPGGATNKGVTQKTYNSYRLGQRLSLRSVKEMERGELEDIYYSGFWVPAGGNIMPSGIDYAAFDAAVNSGPGRANRWRDAALTAGRADAVVKKLCAIRLGFVRGLRTWSVFGRGWQRRIAEVEATGVKWALEGMPKDIIKAELEREAANAKDKEASASKKGNGTAAGGGAVAVPGVAVSSTLDHLVLIGVVLLIAGITAVIFYNLARRHRERAKAYAEAANA